MSTMVPQGVSEDPVGLGHVSGRGTIRARLGRNDPTLVSASPTARFGLAVEEADATGSMRSSIEQSRMSSKAMRTFRLSRSGRSVTSR